MLVKKSFNVGFRPALARDRLRMFGANDQEALASQVHAIVPGDRQARPHGSDEITGRAARRITDGQRRLSGKHRDGADVCCEAMLDVEGFPRAFLFILADTERILPRVPQGRFIDFPGLGPAQVEHDQLHRAANRAVRPPAGTEDIGAPINLKPLAHGPIDDAEGGMRTSRGCTPWRLNWGSVMACTAVITTGR